MSTVLDSVGTWTKPIDGPSPTGQPARGDESYEKLRAEIAKLSAAAGGGPSWNDVFTLSTDILTRKSKDLMVASYLVAALVERDGARGLAAGLQLYRDLCAAYWPQLYPELERLRGRISAVAWLSEQAGKALARTRPAAADADPLTACEKLLGEIETLLADKLGDQSPGVGTLRDAVRAAQSQVPAAGAPASPTASAPATAAAPATPTEIASEQDVRPALESARQILRNIASFRRRTNRADASAYRFQRQAEFLMLERVPPATDGKTLVAPPTDVKGRLEGLVGLSKWDALIDTAEGAMRGDALFWLDLHWHVVQALKALGTQYDDARKAVAHEVGRLLQRLPGLETLKFRDGTPFADSRTQSWIDAECRMAGGAPSVQARPLVAPEGTTRDVLFEIENELAAAQRLATDGVAGATEALTRLAQKTRTTDSRREKFLWRLAQARLLSAIDRPDVARAQLELLDEELARLPVAEWDLAVTVEVVRALVECQRKWMQKQPKPTPEAAERLRLLYDRLARLDPAVAIGAGSGV